MKLLLNLPHLLGAAIYEQPSKIPVGYTGLSSVFPYESRLEINNHEWIRIWRSRLRAMLQQMREKIKKGEKNQPTKNTQHRNFFTSGLLTTTLPDPSLNRIHWKYIKKALTSLLLIPGLHTNNWQRPCNTTGKLLGFPLEPGFPTKYRQTKGISLCFCTTRNHYIKNTQIKHYKWVICARICQLYELLHNTSTTWNHPDIVSFNKNNHKYLAK